MKMNLDAYEEQLAREFYQDYIQNPNWKEVAEQADSDELAIVFSLLMSGQEQTAKQRLALILATVARDDGEIRAAKEVNNIREDYMITRRYA